MNKELLEQLEQLKKKAADSRDKLLQEGRLYGQYAPELQAIHEENAKALDALIATHGWPTLTKVGIEGTRLAWEIAQQANCTPDLQRKFFKLLTVAVMQEEAPKKQAALLADRIRFNEGRPQIYGTVLDWNETGELDCELQNPAMVDELRKAVDLPPFEQSRQEHQQKITAESGKPPEDFTAYRQDREQWAEKVGWR